MNFDTTDPIYQELLGRVIQSDARVVPFIGAGLSVFGRPTERLPLWRELIERLVDEGRRVGVVGSVEEAGVTEALDDGRYIEATDRVLASIGEPTFRAVVRRELDDADKPVPPAISELVGIGWSLIVTTNLDRFLARAYFERHGAPINAVPGIDTHRLVAVLAGVEHSAETSLAQIHGDLDLFPSWRLTGAHYQQLLGDPAYLEALKHLFLRQVFFVGFGLQDEDFDILLATIAKIYPAGAGEFFALLPRTRSSDARVQQLVRENGLRPIFYDVTPRHPDDPFGGHRQVYECLQHLAQSWAAATVDLPVNLKYFPELDPNFVGRDDGIAALRSLLLERQSGCVQVIGLGGIGKTSFVQQFVEFHRLDIANAGFEQVFGCSFYRAEVGEFVQDLELACVGPSTRSLPEKVERICQHVRNHRLLLVLDGLENVLDDELRLNNPYLIEIVDAVRQGRGAVVATTRVPITQLDVDLGIELSLGPLDATQMEQFLTKWGLGRLPRTTRSKLGAITEGHPLALRIIAGVLRTVPAERAIRAVEEDSVLDVGDELDPLRANQLARVLDSYLSLLSEDELTFMMSWSLFDRPVGFPMLDEILTHNYVEPTVTEPLAGLDVRPLLTRLLDKRLVATNRLGQLSSHPTVREFFTQMRNASGRPTGPVHRRIAARYLEGTREQPDDFDQIVPLLAAARHTAEYNDWSLFDDIVDRRVMRGDTVDYLCDNLGGWDEALAVARLVPSAGSEDFPEGLDPVRYPAIVSRCLKHLGRSDEAVESYLVLLRSCADLQHPETAMHLNTFLTLLVWRGELAAADVLVEPNLRAISWISEDRRRRWQIDYGLSTIAYLRLLQGDLDLAERLFVLSTEAWDGFDDVYIPMADHYPLFRSELFLRRGEHEKALTFLLGRQQQAIDEHWPETVCRGHLQLADMYRCSAIDSPDPGPGLARARHHIDQATAMSTGLAVAEVATAHALGELKLELAHREAAIAGTFSDSDLVEFLDEADSLVSSSKLHLAAPEILAGRGHIHALHGDREAAAASLRSALHVAVQQGNALYPSSQQSLVGLLSRLLEVRSSPKVAQHGGDPSRFVGESLGPAELHDALERVERLVV